MLLLCQHITLCTDTLQICMHKMHTVITGHIKYAQKVWHFPFNAVFFKQRYSYLQYIHARRTNRKVGFMRM